VLKELEGLFSLLLMFTLRTIELHFSVSRAAHRTGFNTLGGLQQHTHMAATSFLIISSVEKDFCQSAQFRLLQTRTAAAW